jgi:phage head maturation protease
MPKLNKREDEEKEDSKEKDQEERDDEKEETKDEKRENETEDDEDNDEKAEKKDQERCVELVFSTGSGVVRRDENGSEYLEVLSLEPDAIDLSRLNSGAAPLLNSHASDELTNILGVIERAWVDPVKKQGVAQVRFSRRPDADLILQDVKDKIIVSTSVGYTVKRWKDITQAGDPMPVRLVTEWVPCEISLVGVPADPQSQVRKKLNQQMEMKVMTNQNNATQTERKRGLEIRKAVKAAHLSDHYADTLIEKGVSLTEASELIIGELTRSKQTVINHASAYAGHQDEVETRRIGIENAILHSMAPHVYKLEARGRPYAGAKLIDFAKMSTRIYGGQVISDREFYNNPIEIYTRAFNGGISDFPAILANVMNKELRRGFESAPATWQAFCRKTTTTNFKPIQRPQLGEAPLMERVNEHGEYRRGGISETNQTYSIDEYGKIMSLPLRVLLDDSSDLGALSRIPTLMGSAAADFMSEKFYELFCTNPTLRNGDSQKPLFDKSNGNVSDSNMEISIDSLSQIRTAFRQQKGQAGRVLNLQPKYLLVPSTMETKVEQFLSQNLMVGQFNLASTPAQGMVSGYNPFANKLIPIVEPRMDAYSKTAWYAIGDLERIDVAEVAYLNGMETPMIISRDGFSSSGVEWRINHYFGFGFIEFRSFYQVPKAKGER